MLGGWVQWRRSRRWPGAVALAGAMCVSPAVVATDAAAAIEAYRAGDYGRAVANLREPAAAGDAAAQFHLGLAYAFGHGVVADPAKAAQWYERAAHAGHAKAQVNLAVLLLDSARGTDPDAVSRAQDWLMRAAAQGDGRAAHHLGLMHFHGHGVARDFTAAREWWEQGVARGDRSSAFNLGVLYRRGLGVARDQAKVIEWWQRAAYAGLAEAQNALGGVYQNGEGVAFDLVEAWAWFQLAAEQGLPVAGVNADLVRSRLDAAGLERAAARRAALATRIEATRGESLRGSSPP